MACRVPDGAGAAGDGVVCDTGAAGVRMIRNHIARLRRTSREEIAWRATVAARTVAHRCAARFGSPRWKRRDLRHALAPDVLHGAARTALKNGDWPAVHEALAAVLQSRNNRFVLDPTSRT